MMQIDTPTTKAEALGLALIKHITEAQAIGSALAEKHQEAIQPNSDAMEEDEVPVLPIGSLTSSEASLSNDKEMDTTREEK
jgi:hypothetical protein